MCKATVLQDIVARGGKLWFLYKRPGQRVIINALGDLIVRPSYIEVTMQQTPFASRLQHHFLAAYKNSLLSILAGQFGDKKLHGGVQVICSSTWVFAQVDSCWAGLAG